MTLGKLRGRIQGRQRRGAEVLKLTCLKFLEFAVFVHFEIIFGEMFDRFSVAIRDRELTMVWLIVMRTWDLSDDSCWFASRAAGAEAECQELAQRQEGRWQAAAPVTIEVSWLEPEPDDGGELPHIARGDGQTVVGSVHYCVEAGVVHLVKQVGGFSSKLEAAARFAELE